MHSYDRGMGHLEAIDPASALNLRAQAEGWTTYCDPGLAFETPELHQLLDIWRARAATKNIPSRADFDARTMKPFLRNISIVERVYVDSITWRYRTRLCGSAIVEVMGERTGRFLDEYLPYEFASRWSSIYDTVLDSRTPLRFVADFQLPQLAFLSGEGLGAPLADSRGGVNLILGCTFYKPKQAAL
jgi:hypothetical protein